MMTPHSNFPFFLIHYCIHLTHNFMNTHVLKPMVKARATVINKCGICNLTEQVN